MASLAHPVVGDTAYGAPRVASSRAQKVTRKPEPLAGSVPLKNAAAGMLSRNFLHAAAIEFEQPRTGKKIALEAPLPEELRSFLVLLKRSGRAGMKL
jgi:23S rRNA pseudouridine1911/1915/1917 synthase